MNECHNYYNQNILLDNNRRWPYSHNLKISEDRNMDAQSGDALYFGNQTNSSVDPLLNAKSGDACYFGNQTTVYLNYSRIGGKSKQYNLLLTVFKWYITGNMIGLNCLHVLYRAVSISHS